MSEFKNRVPDPDEPVAEEEREAAEQLRAALERGEHGRGDHGELIEALRAASGPESLSARRHDDILSRALGAAGPSASNVVDLAAKRRGKVAAGAFGAIAAVVAAAAATVLVFRGEEKTASVSAAAPSPPAVSRSTSELFSQQFPITGGTTDRIDRIAYARQQDLRENRFLAWGVR
jgi:hypothetical protein